MPLSVIPDEVRLLDEEVRKLKTEKTSLEAPSVVSGYTLDKVPAASYKLVGGRTKQVEAWEDWSNWASMYEDNPSQSPNPYEYAADYTVTGLRSGFRYGENGKIEKQIMREEYEPYKWELTDPHSDVRSQLTDAENTRISKLTDTRNTLAEKESRLLAYNRSIRGYSQDDASRPGTRRKSLLGGRPFAGLG